MSITWIILLSSATTILMFCILLAIWFRRGPWHPWTREQDNSLIVKFNRFERTLKEKYNIHDACGCDDCMTPPDTPEQMADKLTANYIRRKLPPDVYDVSMDFDTGDILIKRKKVTGDDQT